MVQFLKDEEARAHRAQLPVPKKTTNENVKKQNINKAPKVIENETVKLYFWI